MGGGFYNLGTTLTLSSNGSDSAFLNLSSVSDRSRRSSSL